MAQPQLETLERYKRRALSRRRRAIRQMYESSMQAATRRRFGDLPAPSLRYKRCSAGSRVPRSKTTSRQKYFRVLYMDYNQIRDFCLTAGRMIMDRLTRVSAESTVAVFLPLKE